MRTFIGFVIIIFLAMPALAGNEPSSRYFFSGDGEIHLKGAKSGVSFKGRYRNPDGTHDDAALRQIHQAFSAKYGDPISKISPRFIEFLDYLEDRFNKGARITIVSGYRSPTYNTDLRNKGKLAAKASMHQYGMAADIRMQGVNPRDIWNYVKDLKFGGTGFYQGANVHVDVGPARFWDQTSSKVGTGIADDNKLIEIVADKDIYRPGEEMKMRFIRMTLFPIGVKSEFILEKKDKMDKWKKSKDFKPTLAILSDKSCTLLANIGEMLNIRWTLSAKIRPGDYRITASFCGDISEDMPKTISSATFRINR